MSWRRRMVTRWGREYVRSLPHRCISAARWTFWLDYPRGRHQVLRWWVGWLCALADLTPLAWLGESAFLLLCRHCRPLDAREARLVRLVFENALAPESVVLAQPSMLASRFRALAFVTFHSIHAARPPDEDIFVHELMHILQYRVFGSRYIPEALWAQRWGGGYSPGNPESIRERYALGGLCAFNIEQQAMILQAWYVSLHASARKATSVPQVLAACREEALAWRH